MTENAIAASRDCLVGQDFRDKPQDLLEPFDGRRVEIDEAREKDLLRGLDCNGPIVELKSVRRIP